MNTIKMIATPIGGIGISTTIIGLVVGYENKSELSPIVAIALVFCGSIYISLSYLIFKSQKNIT